ncbi:MAG: FkbM family methyltransferase [Chthoniobacterales bacterium]|jgi:FkbM family methyltransferase|nr:FkbM family methyltransferase [Chthoniobacterales bacterium]
MKIDDLKNQFWELIRPLHSPLTRAVRKRLGRNYHEHPEMELPPAYEAVQLEVERRLHQYLHVSREEIQQIVIVGANDGGEIHRMKLAYPRCRFLCFEPSPMWFGKLTAGFAGRNFVESRQLALAESSGSATFHELPLGGNGSLLPPDRERWSRMNQMADNRVTTYDVEVSTLDHEARDLSRIDLLWMDVQGAEGRVLKGGQATLDRTEAAFLEVSLVPSAYRGGMLFTEMDQTLSQYGFTCVGLGIDGWNFTGNALWIKEVNPRAMATGKP